MASKNKLKRKNVNIFNIVLSNLSGLLLALAGFLYFIYSSENYSWSDPLPIAFIFLVAGFVVERVTTLMGQIHNQYDAIEAYSDVIETVSKSFNLRRVNADKFISGYLAERMSNAVHVKNTFIGSGHPTNSIEAVDPSILSLYHSFFQNKGKTWLDAISVNELSGPRFKQISNKGFKGGRHVLQLVRHNIPVLNFTIIEYDDDNYTKELIFGWQYSTTSNNRYLYHTTEPHLISLFEGYFEALLGYRLDEIIVDYSAKKPAKRVINAKRFVDKAGRWLTLGFVDGKVISVAAIDIGFIGHQGTINGRVYWHKDFSCSPSKQAQSASRNTTHEEISHQGNKVSYTDSKMFIEYRDKITERKGVCVYVFGRNQNQERISGYFQDDESDKRVQIIGLKLYEDIETTPVNVDPEGSMYQKIIQKNWPELERMSHDQGLKLNASEMGLSIDAQK